ncbi:cell division protein FtsQ/DivIB [Deinococcus multiflagellatus]|uniref:cell division protein FtsQ/DivIB n=1 Tax=Deinococcus multiflagellatus TaxID=1656887 RepID=UPI001CCDC153|nr:FtsQ-type POTRA domain-containing protein [Deinococcus multiflagellatus]MBZ9714587.1 FtsQ-type POTRA domain-containing protein [Deinococcus multiflagellatus]
MSPEPRRNRRVGPEPTPAPAPTAEPALEGETLALDPIPAPPAVRPRRRVRRRVFALAACLLTVGGAVGAWYALPIRTVTVSGNAHLSPQEVKALAGLSPDFGWLYYGAWRARGLLDSPWVASAVVTRTFPDRVQVQLTERQPRARWRQPNGKIVAVAADATVLPGARKTEALPLIEGWGPNRVNEVLGLLDALARYNVQSVAYTPTGLTLKVANRRVWTGDVQALLKYAGSISMYPNSEISIYPWGVSVQE